MIVREDCRYFIGELPCTYNKTEGVHCEDCPYHKPVTHRILIIKLGAIGDVLRTTPLLEKLKGEYPNSSIYWLSHTPEILPVSVDEKMGFELKNIVILQNIHFDILINLDKDREACALATSIKATTKFGFELGNAVPIPINEHANHKYYTGLFDDISQDNRKSYQEEIFEICNYEFSGEGYNIADNYKVYNWQLAEDKKIIGLNTGCGKRWPTRQWPQEHWVDLAQQLHRNGYVPLLLGGHEEHVQNLAIQTLSQAHYPGYFPLDQFISLVNQCDLVVTTVTMTLHIAIALKKNIVLYNNIFNKHEFELYELGKILEPPICTCFYAATCDKNCMRDLHPQTVFQTINKMLPPA